MIVASHPRAGPRRIAYDQRCHGRQSRRGKRYRDRTRRGRRIAQDADGLTNPAVACAGSSGRAVKKSARRSGKIHLCARLKISSCSSAHALARQLAGHRALTLMRTHKHARLPCPRIRPPRVLPQRRHPLRGLAGKPAGRLEGDDPGARRGFLRRIVGGPTPQSRRGGLDGCQVHRR
jgi:hypothetical protein